MNRSYRPSLTPNYQEGGVRSVELDADSYPYPLSALVTY